MLDSLPVVVGLALVELPLELVDLQLELLGMLLVLLHKLLDLVLIEVFDPDQVVLLLLGPRNLILKQLNLSRLWATWWASILFSSTARAF